MNLSKSFLRKKYLKIRNSLSQKRQIQASLSAYQFLVGFCQGKTILSYSPFHGELDVSQLNRLLAEESRLILPRVEGKTLKLFRVTHSTDLSLSDWNIWEPKPEICPEVSLSEVDVIFVPGLAFDARQHRLGYGGGFYDHLLGKKKAHHTSIGIGFHEQNIKSIPIEPWDISLHHVLTF